ncbi:hypothetical protein SAMN05216199_0245 [Pedococcus cremeus]|uniref:Secreted protein n=1 Tax=Pedococcus cremeus TaxID=587636 RepID=A0A1H9XRW9_9MICO|nr:hypothetical protein [Pedococcus cremeus]SES48915.1 hypothetical protein SAMN05216199_0245 [Pedococcus cremeus]
MLTLAVLGAGASALFQGAIPDAAPASAVTPAPPGSVTAALASPVTPVPPGSVRAIITLPSTTVRGGSSLPATITVENDSGKPFHILGCGSVFSVLLVGEGHRPSPSWPLCAQDIIIPAGVSTYPVTVAAAYQECSMDGGNGMPACERDGSMAPLPAGRYQATTVSVSPDLPVPARVPVTVTPR